MLPQQKKDKKLFGKVVFQSTPKDHSLSSKVSSIQTTVKPP